eukprot:GHVN01082500.1.p1 GENE.GHVN01082500.1~~GHVN01082500.1.p1  ORF type:complete len:989 (+),score=135.40 GHVN01082500.1:329-3295(+)
MRCNKLKLDHQESDCDREYDISDDEEKSDDEVERKDTDELNTDDENFIDDTDPDLLETSDRDSDVDTPLGNAANNFAIREMSLALPRDYNQGAVLLDPATCLSRSEGSSSEPSGESMKKSERKSELSTIAALFGLSLSPRSSELADRHDTSDHSQPISNPLDTLFKYTEMCRGRRDRLKVIHSESEEEINALKTVHVKEEVAAPEDNVLLSTVDTHNRYSSLLDDADTPYINPLLEDKPVHSDEPDDDVMEPAIFAETCHEPAMPLFIPRVMAKNFLEATEKGAAEEDTQHKILNIDEHERGWETCDNEDEEYPVPRRKRLKVLESESEDERYPAPVVMNLHIAQNEQNDDLSVYSKATAMGEDTDGERIDPALIQPCARTRGFSRGRRSANSVSQSPPSSTADNPRSRDPIQPLQNNEPGRSDIAVRVVDDGSPEDAKRLQLPEQGGSQHKCVTDAENMGVDLAIGGDAENNAAKTRYLKTGFEGVKMHSCEDGMTMDNRGSENDNPSKLANVEQSELYDRAGTFASTGYEAGDITPPAAHPITEKSGSEHSDTNNLAVVQLFPRKRRRHCWLHQTHVRRLATKCGMHRVVAPARGKGGKVAPSVDCVEEVEVDKVHSTSFKAFSSVQLTQRCGNEPVGQNELSIKGKCFGSNPTRDDQNLFSDDSSTSSELNASQTSTVEEPTIQTTPNRRLAFLDLECTTEGSKAGKKGGSRVRPQRAVYPGWKYWVSRFGVVYTSNKMSNGTVGLHPKGRAVFVISVSHNGKRRLHQPSESMCLAPQLAQPSKWSCLTHDERFISCNVVSSVSGEMVEVWEGDVGGLLGGSPHRALPALEQDCVINTCDDGKVKASIHVLEQMSALFKVQMIDKGIGSDDNPIEVESEESTKVVEKLVQHMYTARSNQLARSIGSELLDKDLSPFELFSVFRAADKHCLNDLKMLCEVTALRCVSQESADGVKEWLKAWGCNEIMSKEVIRCLTLRTKKLGLFF